MDRISELSIQTERTGVKVLIRNIQSNLDLYKSQKMITGEIEDLAVNTTQNPVGVIFPPMENYRGEFDSPDPYNFSPGEWYYDKGNHYLVYHVIHPDRFNSPVPEPARIRLKLEPVYHDTNNNGQYDQGIDRIKGLALKSVDPYEWQ